MPQIKEGINPRECKHHYQQLESKEEKEWNDQLKTSTGFGKSNTDDKAGKQRFAVHTANKINKKHLC